jgi:preprotein translocase subunit YajC
MEGLLLPILVIVVFYFFMIRPQMKRQKELKNFRENLTVGDKVVTVGGLHGKILELADTTVLLSCESSTKIRVEKSALVSSYSEAEIQPK